MPVATSNTTYARLKNGVTIALELQDSKTLRLLAYGSDGSLLDSNVVKQSDADSIVRISDFIGIHSF